MKKINKLAVFILFAMILTSCNDFLSKDPISSFSPNTYWKTKEDAGLWLAGTYDAVQSTLKYTVLDWGEFRSDNVEPLSLGTGNQRLQYNNALVASGLERMTSWSGIYTTISRCNYGIKYLPTMIDKNIGGGIDTYKDQMGQYYGLRALMYFYAIRVWGRVPIVGNTPIESLTQIKYIGRSTIDSCKAQIKSDLDSCIKYVNASDKKYNFSISAAYALQTDFHMWFKEFDLAEASISRFEALKFHSWITTPNDWKNIFTQPDLSKETIFNIYYNGIEDAGYSSGIGFGLGSSDYAAQFVIRPSLWSEFTSHNKDTLKYGVGTKDARWYLSFDTISFNVPLANGIRVDKCGKYFPWDATLTRAGSVLKGGFVYDPQNLCNVKTPIYRYADIMLMKAEILCRKGEYQKALDIVNAVRKRVGFTFKATLDQFTTDPATEVFDCIMNERKIELFGEGKRWFDLIRASNTSFDYFHKIMDPEMVSRVGGADFLGVNEGKILFPIEATAFAANPALRGDQNPPYSE